jgi:uncharacterized protein YjbJ (UPF0337 family)
MSDPDDPDAGVPVQAQRHADSPCHADPADLNVRNGSAWAVACSASIVRRKGVAISATDKAKDKVQAAKGKVKKGTGKATDDPYMEGEGKAEEMKGNLKQAGEKVKDAFKK